MYLISARPEVGLAAVVLDRYIVLELFTVCVFEIN